MKHIIRLSSLLMLLIIASCADFLDKAPEEDITIEEAFLQRAYAEAFLTDVYAGLPLEIWLSDWGDANPYVLASDEMNMPYPEKYGKLMNRGAWNPYNANPQQWINMYESCRKANIFLDNIHLTPITDGFSETDKNRWIGEAILLRAICHFFNIRTYGPVPIMDYTVSVNDDFYKIKRQPLDVCIQFVLDECDRAIDLLPMRIANNQQYGRMSAAMAYAIKARLLLYRASPLFNGNPDYYGFKDNDGELLFPQTYEPERWTVAVQAIKECIDKCEAAGFALYRSPDNDPIKNFAGIFLVNNNQETIMGRNCGLDALGWGGAIIEACCFPRSWGGWASYNPTQNLVDAYEMENGIIPILGYRTDGSPIINPESGYREEGYATEDDPKGRWVAGVRNMYINRDPRFYASINFNGKMFKGKLLEFWNTGADGRGTEGRDYNCTGYTMNKYVDEAVNIPQRNFGLKVWIFFRLGEQYLNYAEALNEAQGPVADVYRYVNLIRDRAGMPPLPSGLNQEQMRERIRRERQVELAFETHRFFDCHRWKIAHITDNGPIYGLNIAVGTHLQDDEFYVRTVTDTRVFRSPVHYLFPIAQSEINKNPSLIQNPGW